MSTQRRPGSLTTRLLVAQIGVAVASALTMLVVAAIVGPPLFEAHMHQAGHNSPDVLAHSQEAFSVAGTLALGIGLAIGATGAVMVSVLISRRLRRSLDDLGAAAVRISEGDFNLRVERPDSRELATLADSFNTMAGRLAGVEATRRRLLSDLAHEVRTPLASMAMCVESLEDGAIEPGPGGVADPVGPDRTDLAAGRRCGAGIGGGGGATRPCAAPGRRPRPRRDGGPGRSGWL